MFAMNVYWLNIALMKSLEDQCHVTLRMASNACTKKQVIVCVLTPPI